MALGVGTFTVQNKALPGAYINFVSAARADASLAERGVAAMPFPVPWGPEGEIVTLTAEDFFRDGWFGHPPSDPELRPLRELFIHARTAHLMRLTADAGGDIDETQYTDFLQKIELYSFNTLGAATDKDSVKRQFADFTKRSRERGGVKFQCVLHDFPEACHEGIISVANISSNPHDGASGTTGVSRVLGPTALVSFVVGAQAGCRPGRSLTNMLYNGELTVECPATAAQLEDALESGSFVFHRVGDHVRVLEDINTLTDFSPDKNRDFADNQTIRLIDQIAGDIAALFNDRYIGKVANDASGRVSLWSDIVAHHRHLELLGALEGFTPEDIAVEQGETKKSVTVRDCITPTGAMTQLYMTVVIA